MSRDTQIAEQVYNIINNTLILGIGGFENEVVKCVNKTGVKEYDISQKVLLK